MAFHIVQTLNIDFDAAHPKDHFGPWGSSIKMHQSTVPVKQREKNAPETENDRVYRNKGIKQEKPYH